MEKKQFVWDFCSSFRANSELLATSINEKHQKVFFYTNLVPKARLMENLGLTQSERVCSAKLKCPLLTCLVAVKGARSEPLT